MKPQQEWPRRGGVQQADSDSIAKSPEREHSHEQSHGEVEILGEKDLEATRRIPRWADGHRTLMCGLGTQGYPLNGPFGLGKLGGATLNAVSFALATRIKERRRGLAGVVIN
jgi:hypothetical protein